jgi:hypothetical protein
MEPPLQTAILIKNKSNPETTGNKNFKFTINTTITPLPGGGGRGTFYAFYRNLYKINKYLKLTLYKNWHTLFNMKISNLG